MILQTKFLALDTSSLIYLFKKSTEDLNFQQKYTNIIESKEINILIFGEIIGEFLSTNYENERSKRLQFLKNIPRLCSYCQKNKIGLLHELFAMEIKFAILNYNNKNEFKNYLDRFLNFDLFDSNTTDEETSIKNLIDVTKDLKIASLSLLFQEIYYSDEIRKVKFEELNGKSPASFLKFAVENKIDRSEKLKTKIQPKYKGEIIDKSVQVQSLLESKKTHELAQNTTIKEFLCYLGSTDYTYVQKAETFGEFVDTQKKYNFMKKIFGTYELDQTYFHYAFYCDLPLINKYLNFYKLLLDYKTKSNSKIEYGDSIDITLASISDLSNIIVDKRTLEFIKQYKLSQESLHNIHLNKNENDVIEILMKI